MEYISELCYAASFSRSDYISWRTGDSERCTEHRTTESDPDPFFGTGDGNLLHYSSFSGRQRSGNKISVHTGLVFPEITRYLAGGANPERMGYRSGLGPHIDLWGIYEEE